MNGILYYNRSNNNVLNKDLKKANPITLHYKENTDMVDPEILISPDINIKDYNYIKVSGNIDRYYYINSIEYSQQYCILKCHVDVLMSYKDDILKQTCIIKRQEDEEDKLYDHYLNDERYVLRNIERIQLKLLGGTFREEGQKTASYVLVLNGSGNTITPPEPEPEPEENQEGGE